jgi:transcriptional regulator with XRE-family HTH domain
MSYKSEQIIGQLKAARQAANVSQRALSSRSGLTQAHISKIESGTVDPSISSLVDLARSLDLELTLVPRKMMPAVEAISRGSTPTYAGTPLGTQAAEVAKFERLLNKQKALYGSSAALDQIEDSLHMLRYVPMRQEDLKTLQSRYGQLKRHQASPQSQAVVREVADVLRKIRNRLAHDPNLSEPRPAYAFDDDEGGDA